MNKIDDLRTALSEMTNKAISAEQQGVAVDWKNTAISTVNFTLQSLTAILEENKPVPVDRAGRPMEDEDGNPIPVEDRTHIVQ